MLDTVKELLGSQYEAAFCVLDLCIDKCADSGWNVKVCRYPYCQVVFHTLFFADFYLGYDDGSFREQMFHRENADFFGDYEQLEDREPVSVYERAPIKAYLEHCRNKASQAIGVSTADALSAACGFERRAFSRAELHVYNIRHIQHHSAQLTLRLRLDSDTDIPWVGSGRRDA